MVIFKGTIKYFHVNPVHLTPVIISIPCILSISFYYVISGTDYADYRLCVWAHNTLGVGFLEKVYEKASNFRNDSVTFCTNF